MSEIESPNVSESDAEAVSSPPPVESLSAPPANDPAPIARPKPHRLFWGAVGGCLVIFVLGTMLVTLAAMFSGGNGSASRWTPGPKIAVVPIEGEILDAREAINRIHEYGRDDSVKALVIRINSPGGAIVPSQEIFEEIRKIRKESGKPIIASLDSIAASGGYYIAVACDEIVANPGTLTGSIGVIFEWFNVEKLLEWAKLKPETITSGNLKSAGSPFRQSTESEKAYFRSIVDQLHSQFVRAVADGRKGKLTLAEIAKLADGRVFTGEEAKRLKLVDELGNLEDAVALAARLAGVEGRPRTIYPEAEKATFLDLLTELKLTQKSLERMINGRATPFLYKW